MTQHNDFKKADGQIQFLRMLLSLGNGSVASNCFSSVKNGKRNLNFYLNLCIDEEFYQLCLDLALQNLIAGTIGAGGDSNVRS